MKSGLRKAFSLVELLVVIAIMLILAALLMPVLGKVREKGRMALCQGNLRQLHSAAINYAIANEHPT